MKDVIIRFVKILSRFFKTDILKLVRENRKDLLKNCFLRITLTA